MEAALARYSRQVLFPPIGEEGQRRLRFARVALIGCGALGTVLANSLARAGVGFLRILDRDFIELDNLQRQVLFDEHDIAQNLPKAEAAARKLRKVNSAIEIEGIVADVNPSNIESFCQDVDLLLDGTDNFETRFLINDVAVKHNLPWVYGACIAAEGMVLPILPRETPCLRCIWEEAPPPGTTPTCDTAGVLGPVVDVVASIQALEALKILTGRTEALIRDLISIDLWSGQYRRLNVAAAREQADCRCCRHDEFDYLAGRAASNSTSLCGRNAVQVLPPAGAVLDLKALAGRLGARYRTSHNDLMLRFSVDDYQVVVFRDGRAIIKGTSDPAAARSVYSRYVGL